MPQKDHFTIGSIVVSVVRKPVKSLRLRVRAPYGEATLSAPASAPDRILLSFLESRRDWLERECSRLATAERPEPGCAAGDLEGRTCRLWGRVYKIVLEKTFCRKGFYLPDDSTLVLRVPPKADPAEQRRLLEKYLRHELEFVLPSVMSVCSQIVGVKPSEWRIKKMRTRWGTCNVNKKRVWINFDLVHYSPDCLHYIATHELVHLLEPTHNERFRSFMDKFYPDWRKVKQILAAPVPTAV